MLFTRKCSKIPIIQIYFTRYSAYCWPLRLSLEWSAHITKSGCLGKLARKKDELFISMYLFESFCTYCVPHNYAIPLVTLHAIPQNHSFFYPHRWRLSVQPPLNLRVLLYGGMEYTGLNRNESEWYYDEPECTRKPLKWNETERNSKERNDSFQCLATSLVVAGNCHFALVVDVKKVAVFLSNGLVLP